jgi:phage shock protein PspC (stress-responsive transcriptional regulator)
MTMNTKLQRSRSDKMIAGVCAGLAQYFGMDVTTVRLVAAALLLFTHVAIVPIYIILWIIMPVEPAAAAPRYDSYTGQPLQ